MQQNRFRYWADPICISAVGIYAINRWMLKPHGIGGDWVSGYLNDLLCLPLFLPLILYVQRWLGLRKHDRRPRMWEVLQHWLIFSIVFEIILPMSPHLFRTTRDPLDSVAYLSGGLIAWLCWQLRGDTSATRLCRDQSGASILLPECSLGSTPSSW